jgi:hypothetical protein
MNREYGEYGDYTLSSRPCQAGVLHKFTLFSGMTLDMDAADNFQKTVDKRGETCFNALKGCDEDGRDAPGHRDPAEAESRTMARSMDTSLPSRGPERVERVRPSVKAA